MGHEKKKCFSFDEAELEWINPLINEWVKENEGKKQGDLIVQLLKEFKLQKEGILTKVKSQPEVVAPVEKKKRDYFGRIRDVLNINLNEFESRARQLQDELQNRYEEIKGNLGKSKRILGKNFNKLESRVNRLFSRSRDEAEDARVEDLVAEVERLQTIVNELKAKVVEQEEDEEEDSFDEAAALATEMDENLSHAQATAE